MAKETVQITGLKELDRKVRELTEATGKNFLSPALRKAANLIRDQAQQNAPMGKTGDLKDSIKVRRDSNPMAEGKNEIMYVRPFTSKKYPVYYWRFVEFGTLSGKQGEDKPGKRFLTRAYDSEKLKSVKVFKEALAKAVIRETKKLHKK